MAENIGKVVQVIGPTVDCEFEADKLPEILNAIKIEDKERKIEEKEKKPLVRKLIQKGKKLYDRIIEHFYHNEGVTVLTKLQKKRYKDTIRGLCKRE